MLWKNIYKDNTHILFISKLVHHLMKKSIHIYADNFATEQLAHQNKQGRCVHFRGFVLLRFVILYVAYVSFLTFYSYSRSLSMPRCPSVHVHVRVCVRVHICVYTDMDMDSVWTWTSCRDAGCDTIVLNSNQKC